MVSRTVPFPGALNLANRIFHAKKNQPESKEKTAGRLQPKAETGAPAGAYPQKEA